MIKPIGGYFEWEFAVNKGAFPHSDGVLLNSGRHSLEYILRSLGKINRLWIPYYTCDVVLQPVERLGIPYSFYHIKNDFTIAEEFVLAEGEYLIYTNYFGLMDAYCKEIANRYGNNLILDYAQAFFSPRLDEINTFYSPRKFVGVPDGGIAYSNSSLDIDIQTDFSYERCAHLLKRHELAPKEGYNDFKANSNIISNLPLSKMSVLTQKILASLDYERIKDRRISNFTMLHNKLAEFNELDIPSLDTFSCPMVYPFYTRSLHIRNLLIDNNVFVASYWPNVFSWVDTDSIEYKFVNHIIPLPIDQRYDAQDMKIIIDLLNICK